MPSATSFSGYQHCHSHQQQQNIQQKQQNKQNRQQIYHNNQMLPSLLSPESSPLQSNNIVASAGYTAQHHQKQQRQQDYQQQQYHQHGRIVQSHPSTVITNTQHGHYDVWHNVLPFGQNYQYNQQQMIQQTQQNDFAKNDIQNTTRVS